MSASDKATAQAEVANIQATVESVIATATVISQRAGLNSIDQGYAEVAIQVDASGLLAGDKDAEDAATRAIQRALKQYGECRVGITLTFGWDPDINRGLAIADKINQLLPDKRRAQDVRRGGLRELRQPPAIGHGRDSDVLLPRYVRRSTKTPEVVGADGSSGSAGATRY